MPALLSPSAKQQFFTDAGVPAAGYALYTYAANTTTEQATYTNRAGTVANQNPIILDARGEATIYLSPGVVYDYHLKTAQDPNGSLVWTREDVIADAGDANAVNFDDALAPSYLKTTSDIINGERVSVIRNIDRTKHASLRAGTLADDLTSNINELLEAMGDQGYGELYLPTGIYNTAGLELPGGVSMSGEGWEPYTAYSTTSTLGKGAVLNVTSTTNPGILVQKRTGGRTSGSRIRGLAMKWSHATPGGGWAPTVYEWAIKVDRADDVTVEDVLLVNPYKGIQITGSVSEPAGRLNLCRVFGQPLFQGVEIDYSVDVSSLDRVHFWPFWSDNANVLSWMKTNNAIFLKSNRNDNCELSNLFGYGYGRGILISSNAHGTTSRIRGQNIDFDDVKRAFWVDSTADASSGSFTNFNATANPATAGADMIVSEGDGVDYAFANVRLSNSQQCTALVTGTNARFRLTNVYADQWNIVADGSAAFNAGSGATIDVANHRLGTSNSGPTVAGAGTVNIEEWISYTPTVSAQAGTITTASATGKYRRRNKKVDVQIEVTITTNGTGATAVIATLPVQASAAAAVLAGRERNSTGKGVMGQVMPSATQVVMTNSADNTYPGGTGTVITITGSYETA